MTSRIETPKRGRYTRVVWVVLGLLACALIVALVFTAWPLLHPETIAHAPLDPACDLRGGPCTAVFPDGGEVTLAIEPRDIPPVKPLRLAVELKGLEAEGVELDFTGVDMNMGYNRVRLERTGPAGFAGEGMLPVCVRNRMLWEAKVLLQTPVGVMAAPFRFETYRSGTPDS